MTIEVLSNPVELLTRFEQTPIPVLNRTAVQLANLRRREDDVDAAQLAEVAIADPLMILKLFQWVCPQITPRHQSQVETVTAAIVLMGIGPFFRTFTDLPVVENILKPCPPALASLRSAIRCSQRAAEFAYGFALQRLDRAAATLFEITMLHNFGEMLLWCHEPQLAIALQKALQSHPDAPPEDIELEILNTRLCDLTLDLSKRWCLTNRLMPAIEGDTENPQLLTLRLAHRVARNSQNGWNNPKLGNDIKELADLLHMTPAAARRKVIDLNGS